MPIGLNPPVVFATRTSLNIGKRETEKEFEAMARIITGAMKKMARMKNRTINKNSERMNGQLKQ